MTARKHSEPSAEPTAPEPTETPDEGFPRTVRTTFQPSRDITVTRTEYDELRAQGVLIENKGK